MATDTDGKITLVNPVAEEILGCTLSQVIGSKFSEIFDSRNQGAAIPANDPIRQVLDTKRVQASVSDFEWVDADGQLRHVAYSAAPIFDERKVI